MGSENFLTVVANNFDVLAGPVVALVYPLHASIKAMETGTRADDQQWLTYWVLYSLIALFELTCAKLLESFPIWGYAKLFLTCWLVLPQFNGASYLYRNFIRPFYINPYQNSTIWYLPNKTNIFRQPDDVLTAAERYIEENGTGAFQRLINKVQCDIVGYELQADQRGGKAKKNNQMSMGPDLFDGAKAKRNPYMGFNEYDRRYY
ncbi:hypothetical protein V2J09_015374 [Rumex salicifolius]